MTCAEVEELIELHVIGALPRAEGREIVAHLEGCPNCRRLETRARETAQLLRLGVEELEPSPALRSRIRALVGATADVRRIHARRPSPWRSLIAWLSPAPVRAAVAVALIPLLLSAWMAFQVVQLRSQVQATERALVNSWQTSQTAAEILGNALARGGAMAPVTGTDMAPEASGMLYYAPSEQEGVLVVRGLPELSRGSVYQCWLAKGDQRMNAGTLYRERDGRAMLVVKSPMPLDSLDAVGVTVEPQGESIEPRGQRYMWGRVRRT